jgi:ferredoxin
MTPSLPRVSASVTVPKPSLEQVFENLRAAGFSLVGPTVRDNAIVIDEIARMEDLPVGWSEESEPGRYRLKRTRQSYCFRFTVGPHSWKNFLYPPRLRLFAAERLNGKWSLRGATEAVPRYAFIGVRACDLSAIGLQDRAFLGDYRDPHYARRRQQAFVLAVNCGHAASTCFCTSMGTGPRVSAGFDLAVTELPDAFVAEIGTEAGSAALENTDWAPATAFDLGRAQQEVQVAEREMQRRVRIDDLPGMLYDNLESSHWDDVAARCLSCGNCTLVCPTCFCGTVEDCSDLKQTHAERTRLWDSCFALDFSHVHGGNARPTIRSRYRQWLTHKFASWKDQFGALGCVGCGRCITWCPVGIDVREEVRAVRVTAYK